MTEQITVRQAAAAVLSRCDGARTLDGVGFNKFDSYFVRSLMEQTRWTAKQERALHRMLRKYIRQLESYGIDYNRIVKPAEDTGEAASEAARAKLEPMKLDLSEIPYQRGKRLALHSHKSFREEAKAIHGARWQPDMKVWYYYSCLEVLDGLLPYLVDKTIVPSPEAREVLVGLFKQAKQREAVQSIKDGNGQQERIPVKTKPYKHQDDAFQIGVAADQSALLMEQGTGKTLSAIGVAGYRYQKGQVKKLLVVAPLSVVPVWHSEFQKHASFPYTITSIAGVKQKKRAGKLDDLKVGNGLRVLLVNYESAWRSIDMILKWNPDMIVVDESQKIKNGRAKQSKALHKLGDQTTYKMILSGTPITQGPLDTWSQYRFLSPDIFGRRYISFRDRYATMGGYGGYQVLGYKHLEELASKAHSIAFRVTKAEALDLPEVTDQELYVKLSEETMDIYEQMADEFMVKFSETEVATAPIILTQLLRLQQITGGFLPTEDKVVKEFDSAKLNALEELLEDLPSEKKVVIFARFIPEIEAIRKVSEKLGRNPVTLYGATKDRGKVVSDFQNDSTVKDIIIQIQTGGLGITLTAADTAIFYSTTFSYADYDQAKARLHRIGQRNPVTYIHILAEGTIDPEVLQILKDKGDMATQIVDRMKGINSQKYQKKSPLPPFTNAHPSLIIDSGRLNEGGTKLIGLDNKAKGGWNWDETTGRIIRRDEDGTVEHLATVGTLEEAQERIRQLHDKSLARLGIAQNKTKENTMAKKDKKAQKATKATKVQEPEEVMEEAVEELEEVVEEATPAKTKKTKKERKAERQAAKAAATTPAPEKKTKKAQKAEKAPAKAETKGKGTKATDATTNEVSAKELAAELNMDPKVLRKTLRDMFPDHESKERWVWKRGSKELNSLVKKLQKS